MRQKLLEGMTLFSFAVSFFLVAGGVSLYVQRDKISDNLKETLLQEVERIVPELLGGLTELETIPFKEPTDKVPPVQMPIF